MTRAVIYARFSTDLQDDRSIGDQVAVCCEYARKKDYTVAKVYEDAAASGASLHGRPGIQRLIADVELGGFDVLIAESMSRIGRDQEDRAGIRKRLKFFGVAIETPAEGVVTPLVDGIRAVIDSEYLEDLKRMTRRGMRGRVQEGLSAGGRAYGYAAGDRTGQRVILEHEAAVVLRIFQEYDGGRSPRDIARRLNDEGLAPPLGKDWQASVINGNRARGSGILQNALYDGRIVWNRVTMRKDPRTGKRVSRPNPEAEWIVKPIPELRIVSADLFARVQAAKAERGHEQPHRSRRPKHLLAGLLRCGCCGSAMSVNNVSTVGRRIYCSRRKEGGRCANGHTFKLEPIEQRVLSALKSQLTDPRAIERFLKTYREERKRQAQAAAGKRSALERALAQTSRTIDRIVAAIGAGTILEAEAKARLPELRQQRDAATAALAALAPPAKVVELHPAAIERYLAAVDNLAVMLAAGILAGDGEAAGALRELIAAVIIHPKKGEPEIEVTGRLASLTAAELFPQTVVAGTRYSRQKPAVGALFAFLA